MLKIRNITIVILTLFLVSAVSIRCTFIPEHQMLLASHGENDVTRNNGTCPDTFVPTRTNLAVENDTLHQTRISILSWNMFKGQTEKWDMDLQRLSRGKDILLLQEALLNGKLQQLLKSNGFSWSMNGAFKLNGKEAGVLSAAKLLPLDSCGLRHSEPITRVPKSMLANTYRLEGVPGDLLVVNIHGINFTLKLGAYTRQMNDLADILAQHYGPIILAGDFNNWSGDRRQVIEQITARFSLEELKIAADERTTFFDYPVDHIFYRGVEPIAYAVHKVTSSDHNPISVDFRVIHPVLEEQ